MIVESTLQNRRLFRSMPFRVYLPPCYDKEKVQGYPTLYLLHGLQSTDAQWDELGIDEAADKLISSGTVPPFIIVMPWDRTGIDLVQAIPEILVPYIELNFATRSIARYRAIGGISKGGGQALEIGLKYPQIFSAVGMHSPAVQYLDAVIIEWALNIPVESRPALWIDIGMRDSLFPAAQSLIAGLQDNGIAITIQINEGDHLDEYWEAHLEDYLRWYASNWRPISLGQPPE
jgi:enterochelin esterase-like enzyme